MGIEKLGKNFKEFENQDIVLTFRYPSGNHIVGCDMYFVDSSRHKETHVDGLHIYYNPFASIPLERNIFSSDFCHTIIMTFITIVCSRTIMMVPLFQETHMLHSNEKISGGIYFQISKITLPKEVIPLFIYHDIFQYFSSTKNAAGKN